MRKKINVSCVKMLNRLYKKKSIPIVLCILCLIVNHLYMHTVVLDGFSIGLLWAYRALVFALFDVLGVILCVNILTLKLSRRWVYSLSWCILIVLQVSNIVYSRFFGQYLSFNSIGEARNFRGGWWLDYVAAAFKWCDILLLLSSGIFFFVLWKKTAIFESHGKKMNIMKERIKCRYLIIAILAIVLPHTLLSDLYNIYQKDTPDSLEEYISETQGQVFYNRVMIEQKLYYCAFGLLRTQVFFSLFHNNDSVELSDNDVLMIERYVKAKKNSEHERTPSYSMCLEGRNVSFIIVESYLSFVSDLRVNGMEVTPNLNKLRHSEGTYYNGDVTSCITIGESSDAQFVLFTGLLPLKNEITVINILNKEFASLPLMFKEKGYITCISVPTAPFVWHQNEVNSVYGIDSLCSTINDNTKFISEDDELMTMVIDVEDKMKEPFFHVILTASMHSPYEKKKDYSVEIPLSFPKSYTPELCNYLRACWFADKQIGRYVESLKKRGRYDKTVLVITADHEAHPEFLKTPSKELGDCRIPLYIVNANIPPSIVRTSALKQIDVYPSILDLFGLDSSFRGIGKSLFKSYDETVTRDFDEQHISDMITKGNWFGAEK